MAFSSSVSDEVLIKCGRCCCICHVFCGTKMELHHIKQHADGGNDTAENCIPLCLNCHAEVKAYNPHHPKGKKYTEAELIGHRDNWYKKVENSNVVQTNEKYRELDIKTYLKIKELFESERYFLCEQNFAFSFYRSKLEALDKFEYLCGNPDFEFLDSDLESIKCSLFKSVTEFSNLIAQETFIKSSELSSVPEEWEIYQPERFCKAVENLGAYATNVWNDYCNLVKLARRKLLV